MNFNSREGIYELMLELVRIPSVSTSEGGEVAAARAIYQRLSALPYFSEHPEDLRLLPVEGDPLGRQIVFALVRTPSRRRETVVLTGHFDVVDVDVCGPLRNVAFDPEEYTRRIAFQPLPDDAREDLDSGKYLFGRGVADMKCGLAIEMALLSEMSERPQDLRSNLAFLAVPDEENSSAGMRGALPWLSRLRDELELEWLAFVNTEPTVTSGSDRAAHIYTGTVGKLMPLFLCVGRESHVGEYFEGLSASLIASHLNVLLEGSADHADAFGAQHFPPPACLKLKDLRNVYSVTLPERAVAYYNYLTVNRSPSDVLEEMERLALEALKRSLLQIEHSRKKIVEAGAGDIEEMKWSPRVLRVEDVWRAAADNLEDLEEEMLHFQRGLPASMDERDMAIELLNHLLDLSGERGPLVVVGFLPPYYPPRFNRGESAGERAILEAAGEIRNIAAERFGRRVDIVEIFEGIMDLSYTGFSGAAEDLKPLERNMPGWGTLYRLPLEELLKLDVPVLNVGPIGKDCHKDTERLELNYALEVAPVLLRHAVDRIGELLCN